LDPVRRTVVWDNLLVATIGAASWGTPLALFLPSQALWAQRSPPAIVHIIDGDGAGDFDTRSIQRGFDLFGSADAGFSGMRATGHYGTAISNYGDCDGTLRNCQGNRLATNYPAPWFEIEWVFAAPPSQHRKIRAVAPSVANATGGGWTAGYNQTVLGRPKRFAPHDGTLGRMFSGVTSTDDASCRNHTGFANGDYLPGIQLLPTSDCADTWGSDGWQGAHPIDLAGWQSLFDQRGARFAWDFWRLPPEYQRRDRPFLGSNHHTYGETTDYNTEVLANYGAVVPGGTGAPRYQGYPLGLLIRFEAFNFALPSVNSAYFVQATIVNRSEDLWGSPIDYDSLYFGLSQGDLFVSSNSRYALPALGLVVHHQTNVQGAGGPCSDAFRTPGGGNICAGNTAPARGYGAGAAAIVFLKSPLGDLRNKLFTRTLAGTPCTAGLDPFCMPGHPLAGDTLTFSRQAFGDFGGAEAVTFGTGVRAAFGFIAGSEVHTLAGRAITDLNARTQWRTFRSEFWPTTPAHYNKYVPPGGWDYNKDGILDTLALDTCGQSGCVAVDSDTMPGGWQNGRGNIGGLQSFGPFSLDAGDTTSIVYAIVGEADSLQLWSQVQDVLNLYLRSYLTPDAPPPVQIAGTQVTAGTNTLGTVPERVRLFFSDDPERWVDPYLANLADDVDAALPGSTLGTLAALNPTLSADLRARAADNLERLEIYKSCDRGLTFTADGDCDGDPTADVAGAPPGLGWQAYAVYDADAGGNIPNAFTDEDLQDGRTYLYVIVGKTRGATFPVLTPDGPSSMEFARSIRNVLSRSPADPNVASVYVPVSKPAGYEAARVAFAAPVTATVPFTVELTDDVVSGSYRAVFGHEILVARDASVSSRLLLGSRVTVRRHQRVNAGGVVVDSVIRTDTFAYPPPLPFLVEGVAAAVDTTVAGDIATITTRYGAPNTGLGFLLVRTDGAPVFASLTLALDRTTPPELLTRDEFPGFGISANQTVAGTHAPDVEAQLRGAQSLNEQHLLPADSVVPRDLVDRFMVQWRETSASRPSVADGTGTYEVAWVDDPFGMARGFLLNLRNPAATEAEVQAALARRAVATVGLTDQVTADLLRVDQSSLVAVALPFSIRNTTFGRPVYVAMSRRPADRLVLGSGGDTISVAIPPDAWVPGDGLYFLEDIVEDSVAQDPLSGSAGLVLGTDGRPLQRTRRAVTFSRAVLGCNAVRESCNPVLQGTPGATGYAPMRAGDRTRFAYLAGFTAATEIAFTITAARTGESITAVTESDLAGIRVVPNPFVLYSRYQTSLEEPRIVFTGVPPRGTLRIYTVTGQFVQQIAWEPDDLLGDGDIHWNLSTREGTLVNGGLYIWVLTAPSNPAYPAGATVSARGKFVIVR